MLRHWDPFHQVRRDLYRDALAQKGQRPESWQPLVDIVEEESHYQVVLDVPGLRREDLAIRLEQSVLTVEGERKRVEVENGKPLHHERRFGTFRRVFTLSRDVDGEAIEANLELGVLTITLPKRPEKQPKRISIN
ncbi:MAG: Hsp20/alpha crystallin family protein [Myxococcales bacterium]|nr:Hsp20/alpha crystallin family protein [Myxococcales bacterium]